MDANLAYKRHFPAINWLTSYSLYLENLKPWFEKHVEGGDWMQLRGRLMLLLTEEDALNEMVQLVGMDALSAPDRLKMEAARSIREDYLHQNAFHDIDTYSSLKKQHFLMQLILAYYDEGKAALERGMDINRIAELPVREKIGRYKYTEEAGIESEYQAVLAEIKKEMNETD